MDRTIVIWFLALAAFVFIEAITVNLYSIWFAGGAVCAIIAESLGGSLYVQLITFIITSSVLLAAVRPFARRCLNIKKTGTNADRNIDEIAEVTEDIDNIEGTGAVYIHGKTWSARSFSGLPIKKHTLVRIMQIEGVKVIVRVEEDSEAYKNTMEVL